MRSNILLIMALVSTTLLVAKPAYRGPIEIEQADGTTVTVYKHGDEFFHYMTTADGQRVELKDGMLQKLPALSEEEILTRRMQSDKRRITNQTRAAYPLNIAPRGLVILVNFTDVSFSDENTLADMTEMLNGDNYTYNDATGSARQYFHDQSMGQYNPVFDVVGPVTVSNTMSYYGQNYPTEDSEDKHVDKMIQEACKLADQQFNVDFSLYDNNNDGDVDFVYFIYAGYGEADSEITNTIWPHSFWLYDGYRITLKLDGKRINTYACGAELQASGNRDGIGTFCHEFGHVLGLPDLYATNSSNNHTLLDWDIMDYGSYNNDGKTPPAYSAYERFFLGWATPTILNKAVTVELPGLQQTNACCIITSTGNSNLIGNDPDPTEFFLLENRQQTGWDKHLPGHGMLITKIKYSYATWIQNTVNNNTMGVDIMEARTNTGYYGQGTDAFPAGATKYTPYANYPITNIKENKGIITFDFMGGGNIFNTDLENTVQEETVLAIYNIMGQAVATTDLSQLEQGIYIVKTTLGTKKIAVR